jgi:hypothetical protein
MSVGSVGTSKIYKMLAVMRPGDDKAALVDKSLEVFLGHLLAVEAD